MYNNILLLPCVMILGMRFFNENISKIENENDEHMPIGFEVAFPSLLELARSLEIEVPDNSPVLQKIYTKRNLKLTRLDFIKNSQASIIIMLVTLLLLLFNFYY